MKTGPVILVLVGIGLLAFLIFSPVTPPQDEVAVTETTQQAADDDPDAQVEEALRMLQNQEVPPMQAILKIREVAEKHPDNVKANFTLGTLSMQTGQWEKATERFRSVLKQQPEDGMVWRLLAEAQLKSGDRVSAEESFTKAMQLVDDETAAEFENELPELSN